MVAAAIITVAVAYHYFASGSNRAGDIRGFHRAGVDLGIAAQEVISEREGGVLPAELELYRLAGTGRRVFVDSGAFSEVDFGENGPFVVEPITHEEWTRRLDLYERLAQRLGDQLYPVAPDKVAFQWETLDRLDTYRDRIRQLRELGANVIVPHQKGELSLAQFNEFARDLLGFSDFIVGIPMMKDATSIDELREFCAIVKPARLHLLGIGPKSKGPRFGQAIEAIEAVSPETEVFCDSVALSGCVGRSGGKGGGARVLTVALDEAREELEDRLFTLERELDYTDSIGEPTSFLTKAGVKKAAEAIGAELSLSKAEVRAIRRDLDGWLQEDDHYLDPRVEAVIDGLWADYVRGDASASWRKERAIGSLFGGEFGSSLRAA